MSLFELFTEHDGKGCGKWNHYLDIYERHLSKFVGKEVLLFEIGVCRGGSLQIWKKFLGNKCKIVGFDIDKYAVYQEDQIIVEEGNATDHNFLSQMCEKYGTPDIVIDDGSHYQQDIMSSFAFLYPHLNKNGVYVIEDTHCAYRQGFGGGITSPINIATILGRAVHDPSYQFIEEPYTPTLLPLSGICFYNSMIVLEKGDGVEVTPLFTGDEKDKNVQASKPHTIAQITPQGVKEIEKPTQKVEDTPPQQYPPAQQYPPRVVEETTYTQPPDRPLHSEQDPDRNDKSKDPRVTPESIQYHRSINYHLESPQDQRPPSDLSEDEKSLFKWNV